MGNISRIVIALLFALVSPVIAGITVTEYRTVALTNAFAPVSQAQYFAQQTLLNTSPANAQVSGDWMGPNAGGSTNTWHWVGSAQITSGTVWGADWLSITGAGSFSHELTTTSAFIDPRSSSVYTPASAANYECFFMLDEPAMYDIDAQLNQWGTLSLSSSATGSVFNRFNATATPLIVDISGIIPPGNYHFRANSSIAAPNFSNGANHYLRSGSFESLMFSVRVPEPVGSTGLIVLSWMCQRRRSHTRNARSNFA